MKFKPFITILFGLLLIPALLQMAGIAGMSNPYVMVIIAVLILLLTVRKSRQAGEPRDERTKKIGYGSLAYSWEATYLFLMLLFWADALGFIRLTAGGAALTTALFMLASSAAAGIFLNRRGDLG